MRPPKWLLWLMGHTSWFLSGLLIVLLIILVPAFDHLDYWFVLSRQYFAVAALALALTPVILTGGIDLSVGSMTVLSAIVIGVAHFVLQLPLPVAFAAGIVTGLIAGTVNGVLVWIGIPPLVATLATRELYRGLAFTLSAGTIFRFTAYSFDFWREPLFGLPLAVYGIALLGPFYYLLVHHTWIGRMLFSIGDNEVASRFAAVPVKSIKLGCYALVGLTAGLCGTVSVWHYTAARPDSEALLELTAIACVVLGGIRITGGSGHVAGTLLGILTMIMLLAGLKGVLAEWRDGITGILLLLFALSNEATARWIERNRLE